MRKLQLVYVSGMVFFLWNMLQAGSNPMGIKVSVFASRAERYNFLKLSRVWGERYRIYHNLPYLNVLDVNNLYDFSSEDSIRPITLSEIDQNRLKKTSIDYTLCDSDDKPIMAVEFDGLQGGVNIGAAYVPRNAKPDRWRQTIMELKLKVAAASLFPYFVVTYEQFEDLTKDIQLTIVDGIIGSVLTNIATRRRIDEGFAPEEVGFAPSEWEQLHQWEKDDHIQDWVVGIEVESEMEHNPISRLRYDIARSAPPIKSYRVRYLSEPSVKLSADVSQRLETIYQAKRIGAEVTLHTADYGDITAAAWLPNFNPVFITFGLVEDLAYIFAVIRLKNSRSTS